MDRSLKIEQLCGLGDPEELGAYGQHNRNSDNQTQDVASLKPNKNGLYDMHGNVWEWVQDWYEKTRPFHGVDPTGPTSGSGRVVRGGCFPLKIKGLHFSEEEPRFRHYPLQCREKIHW